jgi:hypothetical protein
VSAEKWWTWRWDRHELPGTKLALVATELHLTRWRRGSLLTVYRLQGEHETTWGFYGPFNLALGFGYPLGKKRHEKPMD